MAAQAFDRIFRPVILIRFHDYPMNLSRYPLFEPEQVCLLGLQFNVMSLEDAAAAVVSSIENRSACNIVTPNLNFVARAAIDDAFREAVYLSDLSLPDGTPLVWMARLLRLPITQRVAGSDLFDYLKHRMVDRKIRVFFFGGEDGVAEQAATNLNSLSTGMTAVGYYYPGFETVANMSSPEIIHRINRAEADFIVVSLGAAKGIEWIEQNRKKLGNTAISHLGAVVNFEAGTVTRAPRVFQNLGLEWLWRIYQEPALFKRYWNDGLTVAKLLLTRLLPYAIWLRRNRHPALSEPVVTTERVDGGYRIQLSGSFTRSKLSLLKQAFETAAMEKANTEIDFSRLSVADSFFMGLIIQFYRLSVEQDFKIYLSNIGPRQRKLFRWHNLEQLQEKLSSAQSNWSRA
jgi:N-acetylglucosaminyldiphosphoundecaprenol N-acetyl-beta-D-mannosaminyltransferase